MTYSEFMAGIIDVYTDYQSAILKKLTANYIKERWQEPELDNILAMLTVKHDPKYKTPPSPATFEEMFPRQNITTEAEWWWNEITRTGNSRDSVLIPDIRAQRSVESFGGWAAFCQRDPDNEHWHHKNFVDAFCKCKDSDTPHVLRGNSNYLKPRPPLLYGDKDKCKTILEYHKNNTAGLIENMTKEMRI